MVCLFGINTCERKKGDCAKEEVSDQRSVICRPSKPSAIPGVRCWRGGLVISVPLCLDSYSSGTKWEPSQKRCDLREGSSLRQILKLLMVRGGLLQLSPQPGSQYCLKGASGRCTSVCAPELYSVWPAARGAGGGGAIYFCSLHPEAKREVGQCPLSPHPAVSTQALWLVLDGLGPRAWMSSGWWLRPPYPPCIWTHCHLLLRSGCCFMPWSRVPTGLQSVAEVCHPLLIIEVSSQVFIGQLSSYIFLLDLEKFFTSYRSRVSSIIHSNPM